MRALPVALLALLAFPARGDAPFRDPGRGHYLLAPSGFLLHGGEVVLAQREVLLSTATIGIADHVDLSLGSAAPALRVLGTDAFNLGFGVKAGGSVGDLVHLAVGFDSLSFSAATLGYLFAVVTVGSERINLSVGTGVPAAVIGGAPSFGSAAWFLAGTVGLGRYVALATENWWFPSLPQISMVHAAMVRFTVGPVSLGVGGAHMAALAFPLPWIDLGVRILG